MLIKISKCLSLNESLETFELLKLFPKISLLKLNIFKNKLCLLLKHTVKNVICMLPRFLREMTWTALVKGLPLQDSISTKVQ